MKFLSKEEDKKEKKKKKTENLFKTRKSKLKMENEA